MTNLFKCRECGQEFNDRAEFDSHDASHAVRTVRINPLVLLIDLPDGITPGRMEAAVAFADALGEIRARYPEYTFQYPVFDHEKSTTTYTGVKAWLAVGELRRPRRFWRSVNVLLRSFRQTN